MEIVAMKRPETTFERTDHHLDVPVVPPLPPADQAVRHQVTPKVPRSLPPTELLLPPKKVDFHRTGGLDTDFQQFQSTQSFVAAFVVGLTLFLVGGACFAGTFVAVLGIYGGPS